VKKESEKCAIVEESLCVVIEKVRGRCRESAVNWESAKAIKSDLIFIRGWLGIDA
jgi:hypothetical protein